MDVETKYFVGIGDNGEANRSLAGRPKFRPFERTNSSYKPTKAKTPARTQGFFQFQMVVDI